MNRCNLRCVPPWELRFERPTVALHPGSIRGVVSTSRILTGRTLTKPSALRYSSVLFFFLFLLFLSFFFLLQFTSPSSRGIFAMLRENRRSNCAATTVYYGKHDGNKIQGKLWISIRTRRDIDFMRIRSQLPNEGGNCRRKSRNFSRRRKTLKGTVVRCASSRLSRGLIDRISLALRKMRARLPGQN